MRQLPGDIRRDGGPTERHPDAPKVRADCIDGPRPCPWVSCKYHLFTDINYAGGLRFAYGDDVAVLDKLDETCVLDVTDTGGRTIREIAEIMNTSAQDISAKDMDARRELKPWFEGCE